MRTAVISDIHANLEALRAVLRTIDTLGADRIVCLGDIVGYGPEPNDCLDLVQERCSAVILGNHDSGVLGDTPLDQFNEFGRAAIRWTRRRITKRNLEYLRSLPLIHSGDDATYVHASPLQPSSWRYVFAWPDARRCFQAFSTQFCFIGHTHIPVVVGENGTVNVFQDHQRYLVNVGSVGQARDGNPKASFGLLDTGKSNLEIVRVPYSIEVTAEAILQARLPDYLAQRLFLGI
jgi:diadenosine tetraphosphatase ApaH/serine/threonine PP2A family protein phosphatase